MRILILLDNQIVNRKLDIDVALEKIRQDYAPATPIIYDYQESDFNNLRWVGYWKDAYGIAWDIIVSDLKKIPTDKYDDVIYICSEEHWKPKDIGGWSLGSPIYGMTVQLIRIYQNNPEWLYKTFAMEIAHSWNDICIQELNDDLLSTFGIPDQFDNRVIHGNDSRYGFNVPTPPVLTEYHTDYNYRPMIELCKDKLKLAYQKRLDRFNNPPQFVFNNNLSIGMSSNDVLELQKRFVKDGLAIYTPTGYFGFKTLVSAIAFQKRWSIKPALGFVGILTRGILNANPDSVEFREITKSYSSQSKSN